METSWMRGVKYSATSPFTNGHTTCSTITIVIMDFPAAHHTSQLAGHSAHIYSTICQCCHQEILGRVDHHNWELWDNEKICQHTEEWRDAVTLKDSISIFDKHGNVPCYSELWWLLYWNPTCQLVIDPPFWGSIACTFLQYLEIDFSLYYYSHMSSTFFFS